MDLSSCWPRAIKSHLELATGKHLWLAAYLALLATTLIPLGGVFSTYGLLMYRAEKPHKCLKRIPDGEHLNVSETERTCMMTLYGSLNKKN